MRRETTRRGPLLSEADRASLDAWMAGHEPGPRPTTESTPDRQGALERLLGLLDEPDPVSSDADRRLLVDVTLARVLRARDDRAVARVAPEPVSGPALCGSDARAVDQLIATGWRPGADGRTHKVHSFLSLLDSTLHLGAPSDRGRLVEAALARVQREVDAETGRLRLTPVERPAFARPSIRWRDIGAIAAMFLIACSIFWPMVNGLRLESMRAQGHSNLQRAALGFGMFANDHDDRLPARSDRGVEGVWWRVGNPEQSHSANLYTLVAGRYVPIASLASPANPYAPTEVADPDAGDWASSEQISYSYQLFGKVVPHLATFSGTPGVVLADRSPIVERAKIGLRTDPRSNSANQAGLGQLVLFADGRVRFLDTPFLEDGDNIWLPRRLEGDAHPTIVGTELPVSRSDAFVGP